MFIVRTVHQADDGSFSERFFGPFEELEAKQFVESDQRTSYVADVTLRSADIFELQK